MDRSRIIALLTRKLAGEANSAELEELAALISRYPDSIYYEEILTQLWAEKPAENEPDTAALYQAHRQKYAADFTPENTIAELPAPERTATKKIAPMALAAVTGFLILSCSLFYVLRHKETTMQIIAGKGIRKNVTLPDGTRVWLNSESKLAYASDMLQQGKRIVQLQGEAFFDVAHRHRQPFIVKTGRLSVTVLGTAFNVKDYALEQRSEATLLRGAIELSVNERPAQKILLNPSEKFALEEHRMTITIAHVQPVRIGDEKYIEETSWKDNTLVFKNKTLAELKPRLERWFNVKIRIESDRAKAYRFTGAFKKEDIREAMTAMQLIKPFTFKLRDHDLIIY